VLKTCASRSAWVFIMAAMVAAPLVGPRAGR
jgi:hypothetical protein